MPLNPTSICRGFVLAAIALSAAASGCGFDDSLTRRGFVEEGDEICGQTVVRTAIELQSDPAAGQPETETFLKSLARAYETAAEDFRELAIDDSDASMRDRIVSEFESISTGLGRAAAATASGDPSGTTEANQIFADARRTQAQFEDFGFDVCGQALSGR